MTATTTWMITGASRGLGLGLTTRLLEDPTVIVVVTCRNPEKAGQLNALHATAKGKLHVVKLDVADPTSIRASYGQVAPILGDRGIDILYNNAGILLANDKPFSMTTELLIEQVMTNVAGPMLVSQTFVPLVEKSARKTIVNVSSLLASIGVKLDVRYSSYSITKTALNMLTYKQSVERPDLTIISYDPGWVKTDLGGEDAPIEVEDSVTGTLKVVSSLKHSDSGTFISYDGSRPSW